MRLNILPIILLASWAWGQGVKAQNFQAKLNKDLWVTDGYVKTIARSGNTIYLGGEFRKVGPNTGGGVMMTPLAIQPSKLFPKVNGAVVCFVPDGTGGLYIGGAFTKVGDFKVGCIAHINADYSVDTFFKTPILGQTITPNVPIGGFGNIVQSMVIYGNKLIAGGSFQFGSPAISNLAAFDVSTGNPINWNIGLIANGRINTLALAGDTLWVGGSRMRTALQSLNNVFYVKVDSTRIIYHANTPTGTQVNCITVDHKRIYIGGQFTGATPNNTIFHNLYALNRSKLSEMSTFGLTNSLVSPNEVRFVHSRGNKLYVGGIFNSMLGQTRSNFAVLSHDSLKLQPQQAAFNDRVNGVGFWGNQLIAVGRFKSVNGQSREVIVALDTLTLSTILPWEPLSTLYPEYITNHGSELFIGGNFTSIGMVPRTRLAALNSQTGEASNWQPTCDSLPLTITPVGAKVFIGGQFNRVNGQPRSKFAVLDSATGLEYNWAPVFNNDVNAITALGNILYVGGNFSRVDNVNRQGIATFDIAAEQITIALPNVGGRINDFAVHNGKLYIAGVFTSINDGFARHNRTSLAAFDPTTFRITNFNINIGGINGAIIRRIAVHNNTLYLGGDLSSAAGKIRPTLASIDLSADTVTNWNPGELAWNSPSDRGQIYAIGFLNDVIYIGGKFNQINVGVLLPTPHSLFVQKTNGTAVTSPFAPAGEVYCLNQQGNDILIGGAFHLVDQQTQSNLVGYNITNTITSRQPSLVSATSPSLQLAPNPARDQVNISGLTEQPTPYKILNLNGQVVQQGYASSSNNLVSVQSLKPGLYILSAVQKQQRLVVE